MFNVDILFCIHVTCHFQASHRITAEQLRFNRRILFNYQGKSSVKLMAVVIGVFLLCYGFYFRCALVYILKNGECNDEEYKIPLY